MYLEVTCNTGLVDNGTIQDQVQQAGEHRERATLEIRASRRHIVLAVVLARSSGQRWQGATYGHWYAGSIPERFQFWRAFAQNKLINRSLPGLAMNLQLEPVLQNLLHHGAFHHLDARVSVRFGVEFEAFRMDPIRASFDG